MVVAHFPNALPLVKKILFSVAKRKDLAKVGQSRHAGVITSFESLLARKESPSPVTIDAKTDIAVQQYTGGTTGIPKGVLLTHANIAANMSQIDKWGCGLFPAAVEGDRGPALLPHLRHDRLHERATQQWHAGDHAATL